MTLKECYTEMGGNYDEVIGRLHSERLVQKFALKFLDDPSYDLLQKSLESGSYEEAFRASHTINGVCQNLGLTKLYESSHALTESLRNGYSADVDGFAETVTADYRQTVDALRRFKESVEG